MDAKDANLLNDRKSAEDIFMRHPNYLAWVILNLTTTVLYVSLSANHHPHQMLVEGVLGFYMPTGVGKPESFGKTDHLNLVSLFSVAAHLQDPPLFSSRSYLYQCQPKIATLSPN